MAHNQEYTFPENMLDSNTQPALFQAPTERPYTLASWQQTDQLVSLAAFPSQNKLGGKIELRGTSDYDGWSGSGALIVFTGVVC